MTHLRAVVADDHDLVRAVISSFLQSLGVTVVGEVSNGADAIECARQYHPDVIVMDGNMPVTNGYEATRTIKATMPDVRVAIVSVSEGGSYEEQAALASADAFITKSRLKQSLRRLIDQILGDESRSSVRAAV